MSLEDELSNIKAWPSKIPSTLNGKFAIFHEQEEILSSGGPDYIYQTWFKTPVCSNLSTRS